MTKPRIPGTWSHAAFTIGELLGAKRAAAIADVGLRTFYNWSDPDLDATPSIAQAAILDLAFLKAGGNGAPFLTAFQAATEHQAIMVDPCGLALVEDLAKAAHEFGEAVEHSIVAARPTATRSHVLRAMAETAELESATKTIARRLSAIIRRGAGPRITPGDSL